MSVIIRLQNLPWSANALDIRQYFQGLSIPEGGVHIVGGELGDAFIAFSTDEDARQAFCKNNGKIKEVQINLLLSSRTEMQKVIEAARNNQSLAPFMSTVPPAPSAPIMPAIVPSAVPEISKKDDRTDRRDRRRSRSRSRDRKERSYERKRDRRRSRSKSRDRSDRSDRSDRGDRNRDRRRRDRSRSRERTRSRDRDRRNNREKRPDDKTVSSSTNVTKEHRTNVWESPPSTNPAANSANLLANFVAQNIIPNFLAGNVNGPDNTRNIKSSPWTSRGMQINNLQPENNFIPSLTGNENNTGNNMSRNQMNSNTNYQNFNQNRGGQNNREKNDYQSNSCVKVYPFFGGFGDIRHFFKGIFIHNNGIKLINDSTGKRTGYVFIRFACYEGKIEALNRNGDKLKGATITVEHLLDSEFDEATDRFSPNDGDRYRRPRLENFICLVVENIPPYTKDTDIMNMFSDFPTICVVLDMLTNKKCAYVKFKSRDDAMTAYMEKETHVLTGKHVKVEPCKEELFEKVRDEHIETVDLCDDSTSIISLSGLPYKCSDRDILDFFSDIGVRPAKTTLKMGDQGFTGDAVCEFFNVDDAVLAYQKNGMPFGNGTVSMKYLEDNPLAPKPPILNHAPNFQQMNPGMRMRAPFFPRNQFMGGMPRGPPFRPPFFMGNRGPPPPRRFPPPQMPAEEVGEDEALAPPGCVLLMENIPYKAGVNEILDYFDGFDIPAENILRKFNPNGSPSGEAKVIFNSANEVQQVIQTKRGGRIRERLIYMTQL